MASGIYGFGVRSIIENRDGASFLVARKWFGFGPQVGVPGGGVHQATAKVLTTMELTANKMLTEAVDNCVKVMSDNRNCRTMKIASTVCMSFGGVTGLLCFFTMSHPLLAIGGILAYAAGLFLLCREILKQPTEATIQTTANAIYGTYEGRFPDSDNVLSDVVKNFVGSGKKKSILEIANILKKSTIGNISAFGEKLMLCIQRPESVV